jgi:hypothetical protein
VKRLGWSLVLAAAVAATAAGAAGAAIQVASDARHPTLRVDARGYAEVGWRAKDGSRHTLLVPPSGRVLPGGHLTGKDVSRRGATAIPFKRVVRTTPDGALWALQAWQVVKGGPVDLRFSRWRGSPTEVTATAACCRNGGETLAGAAAFQGRPLFGSSPTTGGTSVRIFAYVDCFGCQGHSGWSRIAGVATKAPDGSYTLFVRPAWVADRYRVTLAGPNLGWTYAPDAVAIALSAMP